MPDNREIFNMVTSEDEKFSNLARQPERPNYRIVVNILLQRALSPQEMSKLRGILKHDEMEVVDDQQRNRIIVSGIPPHRQYNAQSVLGEVAVFDNGARVDP